MFQNAYKKTFKMMDYDFHFFTLTFLVLEFLICKKQNACSQITRVVETEDDSDPQRRDRLSDSYNIATMHARNQPIDALTLVVPISFFIPDPEWKPRQQFVQVFPNSVWVTFLKIWGDVQHAEMVFYNEGASGTMPHCGMAPSYPKVLL